MSSVNQPHIKVLLHRTWDFGDGTPVVTGYSPKHTYTKSGTYDVTMTEYYAQGPPRVTTREQYIEVENPAVRSYDVGTEKIPDNFMLGKVGETTAIYRIGGEQFPKTHPDLPLLRVTDTYGQPRYLSFDTDDRKVWEVFTMLGIGREVVYRDKCYIDYTQGDGTDYISYILTRGASGTLRRYFVEPTDISIYTAPIQRELRPREPLLKKDLYNPETKLSVKLIMDMQTSDMDFHTEAKELTIPRTTVGYDKRVQGHAAQNLVTFSAQPIRVVGLSEAFISRNVLDAPTDRSQKESKDLLTISRVTQWYTRGTDVNDMESGEPLVGAAVASDEVISPDGTHRTAIELTEDVTFDVYNIEQEIVSFWKYTPDGDSEEPISEYDKTSGNWTLSILDNGTVTLLPGIYFDIRVYDNDVMTDTSIITDAYFKDITINDGMNTLPAWVRWK